MQQHTQETQQIENSDPEITKGKDHRKDLGIDGRITSKWILKKQPARLYTEFSYLSIGNNGDWQQTVPVVSDRLLVWTGKLNEQKAYAVYALCIQNIAAKSLAMRHIKSRMRWQEYPKGNGTRTGCNNNIRFQLQRK